MSNDSMLHPSVQKFKQFVKSHPLLIDEVKNGKKTWQAFYEEWVILGEEHKHWEQYKKPAQDQKDGENNEQTNRSSSEMFEHIVGLIKHINFQDLQKHMAQLSSILTNVQQIMSLFQGGQKQNGIPQRREREQPFDPFSFRGF